VVLWWSQVPFAGIPNVSARVQAGDRPRFPSLRDAPRNGHSGRHSGGHGSDLNNTHRASIVAFLTDDDGDGGGEDLQDLHGAAGARARRKSSAAVAAARAAAARADAALLALIARGKADEAACEEARVPVSAAMRRAPVP
jgi:hypothetical protein